MRRADFLRVGQLGVRLNGRYFLILVFERASAEVEAPVENARGEKDGDRLPRLGITVTRRVGKAVRRNRIKRLVREWFRGSRERLRGAWQGYDLVVIAKREIPGTLGLAEVRTDLDRALGEPPARRAAPSVES